MMKADDSTVRNKTVCVLLSRTYRRKWTNKKAA